MNAEEEHIMPVKVNKDDCIGCGACVGVCPVTALSLDDDGKSQCNEEICISCLTCVGTCPVGAIKEKTDED
jgi:Fe-S-cluster-containing hydrogenase component 2